MNRILLSVVLALTIFAIGCKKSKDNKITVGASVLSIAGNWSGTYSTNQIALSTATMSLSQSGSTITGTFAASGAREGSMSGVVSGSSFTFTLVRTSTCTGSFTGSANVTTSQMTFTVFSGTDVCLGVHSSGAGSFTK